MRIRIPGLRVLARQVSILTRGYFRHDPVAANALENLAVNQRSTEN